MNWKRAAALAVLDLINLVGVGCITYGVMQWSEPGGFVVLGVMLVGYALRATNRAG